MHKVHWDTRSAHARYWVERLSGDPALGKDEAERLGNLRRTLRGTRAEAYPYEALLKSMHSKEREALIEEVEERWSGLKLNPQESKTLYEAWVRMCLALGQAPSPLMPLPLERPEKMTPQELDAVDGIRREILPIEARFAVAAALDMGWFRSQQEADAADRGQRPLVGVSRILPGSKTSSRRDLTLEALGAFMKDHAMKDETRMVYLDRTDRLLVEATPSKEDDIHLQQANQEVEALLQKVPPLPETYPKY